MESMDYSQTGQARRLQLKLLSYSGCAQMCHDRGYRVTQEMMEMNFEDWRAVHGTKLR